MKLALEDWRHWLEGAEQTFFIWDHHKNLAYLKAAKQLNTRQTMWALFFTRFKFITLISAPKGWNLTPYPIISQLLNEIPLGAVLDQEPLYTHQTVYEWLQLLESPEIVFFLAVTPKDILRLNQRRKKINTTGWILHLSLLKTTFQQLRKLHTVDIIYFYVLRMQNNLFWQSKKARGWSLIEAAQQRRERQKGRNGERNGGCE